LGFPGRVGRRQNFFFSEHLTIDELKAKSEFSVN